jgi:organic radical activating enzyme
MKALPVYERFHSWQGEGIHLGKSAFFIRLHGCPVHCPWCDSAGTWHPEHLPENIERIQPDELAEEAFSSGCEIVVITGGEPAIHNLHDLAYQLRNRNLPVHLETCGAYEIRGEMDWITLSPKWNAMPLEECMEQADEFKLIIEETDSMTKWTEALPLDSQGSPVWLHPEWSKARDPEVLRSINDWVKEHGAPYRAGYQLHKLYEADEADKRSRPEASLSHLPEQQK